VIIGPRSGVTKNLADGAYVMGMPAVPVLKMKRSHAAVMLLPKMKERLIRLEKKVEDLLSAKQSK
jgi:UDP-3-O-[3-hydroxymyristoyl] glucosamine N-acyltransferase